MVQRGFKKSVQPRHWFFVKKSLRKTYFSEKKVDTLLKIALLQIKYIFATVTWEKKAKTGKSNIRLNVLFGLKKSKNQSPIVQYYLDFSKNVLNLKWPIFLSTHAATLCCVPYWHFEYFGTKFHTCTDGTLAKENQKEYFVDRGHVCFKNQIVSTDVQITSSTQV